MKPANNHVKHRKTTAKNLRAAAILAFASLIPVLPCQSQVQTKIDSLENIIRNAKEDTSLVNNMNALTFFYMRNSDYKAAMEYADSSITLAGNLHFLTGKGKAWLNKARILFDLGNFPEALKNNEAALETYLGTDDKLGLANAYNNIGLTNIYLGNYEEAMKNCDSALEFYTESGSKKGQANAYDNMGNIYQYQHLWEKAAEMYFMSLKINEEIGDKNGMAGRYINLGNVYDAMGNLPEALNHNIAALNSYKELGNEYNLAIVYNNIGTLYSKQKKYPESLQMFLESLQISKAIEDTVGMIDQYINIGWLHLLEKKYAESEKYYQTALELSETIGYSKESTSRSHSNLGKLYMDQGRYENAETHFLAELEISKETEDLQGTAIAYNHLGKLYVLSGDFQKAARFLNESLAISRKLDLRKGILNNLKDLYQLDSAQGHFAKALENFKLYTVYSDSLLGEETNQQINRLKIEYETEKKDKEIELLNKGNEIKALQLSKQKAIRHGLSAGFVLLFITGFLLFRSFRLRKKLEQQQAIINERKRISADLHDDVGSGLSRIMLLTELVKNEAKTPEMHKEAEKIASISKELSANISEIIWALNSNNDYLESLVAYIRRYAAEFFDDSSVSLKINSTGTLTGIPISGELRREIFYTVKEALHNIYKHAQASEAKLGFSVKDDILTVTIHDNGIGMPETVTGRYGNGLTNMQQRMTAAGGQIRIENHQGTKIILEVPVK